ncbi:Flp pilus assembly complex ATPase component TadA [Mycoplasmatota bacterium]|nr:Flp pilus assembly complex ATPase component TadA [Mycoplasmatota bacterium]
MDFDHFLKEIIHYALKRKASDIHFLSDNEKCLVKLRVDDRLKLFKEIKQEYYKRLITYIKYKSHMNLNVSRSPQSSALNLSIHDELMRIRVSTLPSYNSESVVLRINHHFEDSVDKLLLFSEKASIFTNCFKQSNGLILITGPTCSGKTTLTYSLLNYLKKQGLSIVTIEDPVEQYKQGFVQLQVNESAGVNYDSGVKEILRHDPDVILIGEIRDHHTAKSAIRASLTGHLVISTMHATNALKALYRLLELGLSRLDLEQSLLLVSNQRLTVYKNSKKIIFEYLTQDKMVEALNHIKNGNNFSYQKIDDYLVKLDDYKVIKK